MMSLILRQLCRGRAGVTWKGATAAATKMLVLRPGVFGQATSSAAKKLLLRVLRAPPQPPIRALTREGGHVLRTFTLGLVGVKAAAGLTTDEESTGKKTRLDDSLRWDQQRKMEARFDWWHFFRLLAPHMWHLVAAVASAIIAAALNIQVGAAVASNVAVQINKVAGLVLFVCC